jgi:hypothetical protein
LIKLKVDELCGREAVLEHMDDIVLPHSPYLAVVGDIGIPLDERDIYRTFLLHVAQRFEKVMIE